MTKSTTGPVLILFYFYIFQIQLLAYNLENAYTWLLYQESPLNNSHMDADICIFGILDCNVMVASLIHVFSTLTGEYSK